jgi:hypothetical protein
MKVDGVEYRLDLTTVSPDPMLMCCKFLFYNTKAASFESSVIRPFRCYEKRVIINKRYPLLGW